MAVSALLVILVALLLVAFVLLRAFRKKQDVRGFDVIVKEDENKE